MIQRVDIFAPPPNPHKVWHYITELLMAALIEKGVRVRLFDSANTQDPRKFMAMMLTDRPDCTLSLNGLLPDEHGKSLADTLGIPHFAYLVASPHEYLQMMKSPYNIFGTIDEFHTTFLHMFAGTHVLFLPLAADGKITFDKKGKREYEVAYFGDYQNPKTLRASWKGKYNADFCRSLEEATQHVIEEPSLSLIQALSDSLKAPIASGKVDPYAINFPRAFSDLEEYLKAYVQTEMIQAVKGAKIHLFGEGWNELETGADVARHRPIGFGEVVQEMKKAKIVLNSAPHLKQGGDIRFFTAPLCGALPITGAYPYVTSQYPAGVFYSPPEWEQLNDQVHLYLGDEEKRAAALEKSRAITLEKHTWDQRVNELLVKLPPILSTYGEKG